ncbi:MAG TPA: CvpA family protein [Thermodesulfobacteriota bacterium]|nr:CvpA family protein [Thermodesulfobacteriota bacterium]
MFPNILDYSVLIFIVLCYLLSALRAGPKQLFSFILLVGAFFLTGRSYEEVSAVFPEKVFPPSFAGAFSFLIAFLAIFGVLSLLGRLLEDLFKRLSFGAIDSFVTRGLGVLKGIVLGCMLIAIVMVHYTSDEAPILSESASLPYLIPAVRVTVSLLSPEDRKLFAETDKELQTIWKARRSRQEKQGNADAN